MKYNADGIEALREAGIEAVKVSLDDLEVMVAAVEEVRQFEARRRRMTKAYRQTQMLLSEIADGAGVDVSDEP